MESHSDWEIYQVVKVGGTCNQNLSDKMPGTGSRLPEQDIRDVVSYVRFLPMSEHVKRQRQR